MTDWDIRSRSSTCNSCQKPFADKESYHKLLALDAQGFSRRDLCADCVGGAKRDGVICYWQGEYRVPPPPAPEPIQRETAETLLRKLVEATDPGHAAPRYILAVMLERKKILRHRDTVRQENGMDLLVYEHARTGESFTIPDPRLRLDQLQEVQAQVVALLQPAPNSAEAAPSAGTASGITVNGS